MSTTGTGSLRGVEILRDPRLNRSTAFTEAEREALGLIGFLPEGIDSPETQVQRVLEQLGQKPTDLERYIFLSQLQDTDANLFYRVLTSDPARFMPIVYTPTVGEACQKFGHILRRPKGLYLSVKRRGRLKEILAQWPARDVRFIVVTDGERILGLGDLGANGMGIPVGKLALYAACGGVPPHATLPITLDVGTNNEQLLADPLYLGLKQHRVRGAEYDSFIEEFVQAVQDVFPKCCIQFEDFASVNATQILARYRDRVCCFNDDIQATAAIAVAGLMGSLRITGGTLAEQTVLFLGAGSAGTGIAELIAKAMAEDGLSEEAARRRCWLFDVNGLIESTRRDLLDYQKPFAHAHAPAKDFVAAIESLKPTAIIGVSTVAKAFNQKVIEAMARLNERPIIFPFSNPTARSECSAEEAYRWSKGKAVFAAGSPFAPVTFEGKTFQPGQGNNVYIFPAMGMAVYATEAKRVTEAMFMAAARAVAASVSSADIEGGRVYPPQARIRETCAEVAARIAEVIFKQGHAGVARPADLRAFIKEKAYKPH
ncbi:MAG: NAD-dependent malic enzyme [Alphaproteobacteria bacterium]